MNRRKSNSKAVQGITCLVLAAMLLCIGGCNLLEWPTYVLFGQHSQKVKAEYTGLAGKSTAIIISDSLGLDFEYPSARANLALAISELIKKNVKDASFVNYETINAYQQKHLDWAMMPMDRLSNEFNAERIMYLDLYEFNMTEENSVQLLRGRIRAAVRIYETDGEEIMRNRPVFRSDVSVVWPEHGPMPTSDAAMQKIHIESIREFANKLSKKFYDHKDSTR